MLSRVSSALESSAGQPVRSTTCSGVVVVVTTGVVVVVEDELVVVAIAVVVVGLAAVGDGGTACFELPLEHAPVVSASAASRPPITVSERARRGPP